MCLFRDYICKILIKRQAHFYVFPSVKEIIGHHKYIKQVAPDYDTLLTIA